MNKSVVEQAIENRDGKKLARLWMAFHLGRTFGVKIFGTSDGNIIASNIQQKLVVKTLPQDYKEIDSNQGLKGDVIDVNYRLNEFKTKKNTTKYPDMYEIPWSKKQYDNAETPGGDILQFGILEDGLLFILKCDGVNFRALKTNDVGTKVTIRELITKGAELVGIIKCEYSNFDNVLDWTANETKRVINEQTENVAISINNFIDRNECVVVKVYENVQFIDIIPKKEKRNKSRNNNNNPKYKEEDFKLVHKCLEGTSSINGLLRTEIEFKTGLYKDIVSAILRSEEFDHIGNTRGRRYFIKDKTLLDKELNVNEFAFV